MDIDWQLLMRLLRRHYKSLAAISRELGMSHQHLERLERGDVEQPKYRQGLRLLDLGYDVLPRDEFLRVGVTE